MPDEKKEHKKFKAVTEEVAQQETETSENLEISETPIEEIKAPVIEETSGEPETHPIHVSPTDNISNEVKPERGAFLKIFLVTFFATLLAFLLAGGIYVYFNGVKKSPNAEPTATPLSNLDTASPTPEASPASNVDLTAFKIDVLNGNGGIGVATAAKDIIEKAGFTVSTVGNADNFNFTDTLIQVKSNVTADVAAKLKGALDANYSVKIGEPLDSTSSFDIVVTVGSK